MKQSRGVFWGILLVAVGLFWLLRNMGYLHIVWADVFRFWPVFLILAGFSLLVAGRDRGGIAGAFTGIMIALAVLGAVSHKTNRVFNNRDRWDFSWGDHDREERRERRKNRELREYDEHSEWSSTNRETFQYKMEPEVLESSFNLEGGAGEFRLGGGSPLLFEANTETNLLRYVSNIKLNKSEGSAEVRLKMEEGDHDLKGSKPANQVSVKLNETPIWSVHLELGAGKGDFDFSKHKVKWLKVETGVSDLEIRLGDKHSLTDVEIDSGVASIEVKVPKNSGCQLQLDGALNAKDLDDFDKVGDGLYQTPGYEKATNKIKIKYDAGLSSVKIKRY